ncbi:MAG: multidrug efflux SMR transporter [Selenomonadaceae bacterium]|nr:multidrug efflux SMR transporter [Selenomonadaceae bacterium]
MIGYIYLAVAIAFEVGGTTCLKLSDGFANIPYAVGTLLLYSVSFFLFSKSLKMVDLSIAYATWGGLGIVITALIAYFFFHENISTLGILGIAMIVTGVVLCNFFGVHH